MSSIITVSFESSNGVVLENHLNQVPNLEPTYQTCIVKTFVTHFADKTFTADSCKDDTQTVKDLVDSKLDELDEKTQKIFANIKAQADQKESFQCAWDALYAKLLTFPVVLDLDRENTEADSVLEEMQRMVSQSLDSIGSMDTIKTDQFALVPQSSSSVDSNKADESISLPCHVTFPNKETLWSGLNTHFIVPDQNLSGLRRVILNFVSVDLAEKKLLLNKRYEKQFDPVEIFKEAIEVELSEATKKKFASLKAKHGEGVYNAMMRSCALALIRFVTFEDASRFFGTL